MKSLKTLILIGLLFICCTVNAQQTKAKPLINNLNLTVSKLVIQDRDISDSLKTVSISKDLWIEYNKNNKEIGRAEIIKNSNNHIKVKWISATNGAKKDALTIYKISNEGSTYTVDIYYDDMKQGYFIAESN